MNKGCKTIELKLPVFIAMLVLSILGLGLLLTIIGVIYKAHEYRNNFASYSDNKFNTVTDILHSRIIKTEFYHRIAKDHNAIYKDIVSWKPYKDGDPFDQKTVLLIDHQDSSLLVFFDYLFGCSSCPTFSLIRANIQYTDSTMVPLLRKIVSKDLSWSEYLTYEKLEGGDGLSEKK